MIEAILKVIGGKNEGRMIALKSKKFIIGREQDCHLRPNSETISRHHCAFTTDEYAVRLRDFGSTNGTYVNDDRVAGERVLVTGDRIRVGKLNFEIIINENAEVEPLPEEQPVAPSGEEQETSYEMPAQPQTLEDSAEIALPTSDTTIMPGSPSSQPADPNQAAAAAAQYQQPMPYPPQQMWNPQMPWGYPPGYAPQPYPGMPGYGYPPQQPGYPPQGQPPQQEQPAQNSGLPEVRLPNPEDTGAKPPEPKPAEATDDSKPKETTPSEMAANLLKRKR